MKLELHFKDGTAEIVQEVSSCQIVEGRMQVYNQQQRMMAAIPLEDIDWLKVRGSE